MSEPDALKRKMMRPLPTPGIERRIYAAVGLLLLFGVAWSISSGDWQHFERSGSLVILVGIGVTWHDHVNLLGKVEDFYRAQYERLLTDFDSQSPRGLVATAFQDRTRAEIVKAKLNAETLIPMLRRRVRTTEAAIVCLGTLIWGYGSVIGNAVWSFR